jgi:hypothetical protein
MAWDRQAVAAALVDLLGPAVGVTVHARPPELLTPMCVVVGRPQPVVYATAGLGVDEATLPLIIVGGVETEDQIETLKTACRNTIAADPGLGGVVQICYAAEERNWRNVTGAGGVQLLLAELILNIHM